jgi:hypothetical protein
MYLNCLIVSKEAALQLSFSQEGLGQPRTDVNSFLTVRDNYIEVIYFVFHVAAMKN